MQSLVLEAARPGTVLAVPAGYALARFRFPGRNAFRMLVLMTRAFPLPLLALPLAVFFIEWGLDDSVIGLALFVISAGFR